jgi:hypothetical protein
VAVIFQWECNMAAHRKQTRSGVTPEVSQLSQESQGVRRQEGDR